jgi:hypothetical protein
LSPASRRKARTLAAHLAEIVAQALKKLPIPKVMRWGDSEHQFVRPVHSLILLHGEPGRRRRSARPAQRPLRRSATASCPSGEIVIGTPPSMSARSPPARSSPPSPNGVPRVAAQLDAAAKRSMPASTRPTACSTR